VAHPDVSAFYKIKAQPRLGIDAEVALAWDRSGGRFNGRVYALWTQATSSGSNNTDVLPEHSDDAGKSWSRALRINTDTGTNSQFQPRLALDQTTGRIAITWYDSRNDLGRGGPGDTDGKSKDDAEVWGVVGAAGGTVFTSNFQISAGTSNARDEPMSTDYGDYEGLAFQRGVAFPAWADNSNSTGDNPDGALTYMDLYTAKIVSRARGV